jgi:hypothetical protein
MTRSCRLRAGGAFLVLAALCGPAWADVVPGPDFAQAMAAVDAGDPARAVAIFAGLADAGDPAAQLNLAVLTARGQGIVQHDADAAYWAWRARLAGLAAAVAVSDLLTDRLAPEQVADLAARLAADLTRLADAGAAWAFLALARVELGLSDPPDAARAYTWAALAAALDVPGAAGLRDALSGDLDAAARISAQTEAAQAFGRWCRAVQPPVSGCAAPG